MPIYGVEVHGIQLPNNAPLVIELRENDPSDSGLTPGRVWYNSIDENIKYVYRSKKDSRLYVATIPNDIPDVVDFITNSLTELENRISVNETSIKTINKQIEEIDSFINITLPSFSGTDYIGGNSYTSENNKIKITTGTLTDILHQIVELLSTTKISDIIFDKTITLPDNITIEIKKRPENIYDVVNKQYIDDFIYNLMYRLYGMRVFVREVIDVNTEYHTIEHRLRSVYVNTRILVYHEDDNLYWQDQVNVRINDENSISFKCNSRFILIIEAFGPTELTSYMPSSDV